MDKVVSSKKGLNESRRNFIKKSLLSAGAFFVSVSPLKTFAASLNDSADFSQSQQLSLEKANELARRAKELLYQKDYNAAIAIYQQIIQSHPDHIQFYDSCAKVLRAQQKLLESAELFREGLMKNPENPDFMHRFALSVRRICVSNNKATCEFISKYENENLYDYAARILLEAIRLNPQNKSYYFDLIDFADIQIKNRTVGEAYFSVTLSEDTLDEIRTVVGPYEKAWTSLRASRKPVMKTDIEKAVKRINQVPRRHFYFKEEIEENILALRKARKAYLRNALNQSIEKKQVIKVDLYGMMILSEDMNDTETIGKLRRYYKKNKDYIRLISLNRYLYNGNRSVQNTLALAAVLSSYGSVAALSEARELLDEISDPDELYSVYSAIYYMASANINIRSNQNSQARKILLAGIEKYDGKGGYAYALMEKYAESYAQNKHSLSVDLLKALAGKEVKATKDPIWNYIQKYRAQALEIPLSVEEQIKPLRALAKIQQKNNQTEYTETIAEIKNLMLQKEQII